MAWLVVIGWIAPVFVLAWMAWDEETRMRRERRRHLKVRRELVLRMRG